MKIDISLKITAKMLNAAKDIERKVLFGHFGTHFDVMDKEFPLEYTQRKGIIFNVRAIRGRDIELCDIDINKIEAAMFVAFYTGFSEEVDYGTPAYFKEHPQLSKELIAELLKINISLIGIDCAGLRRGGEHPLYDQRCADQNVFVIENLCNLSALLIEGPLFIAHTYPLNCSGMTGLPCRVIAETFSK